MNLSLLDTKCCFISLHENEACSLRPHINILSNTLCHVFELDVFVSEHIGTEHVCNETTEERIRESIVVFVFLSKAYLSSNACCNELIFAKKMKKKLFVYVLDEVDFTNLDSKMYKIVIETPYSKLPSLNSKQINEYFLYEGYAIPFEILQKQKCVISSLKRFTLPPRHEAKYDRSLYQMAIYPKSTIDNQNNFGQILICDSTNRTVAIIDSNGNFLFEAKPFMLAEPKAICVSLKKEIFVADWKHHRIFVFDKYFDYIRKFPSNTIEWPTSMDIDNQNNILFVADSNDVKVFDSTDGELKVKLPIRKPLHLKVDDNKVYVISDNPYNFISVLDKNTFDLLKVIKMDDWRCLRGLYINSSKNIITTGQDENGVISLYIINEMGLQMDKICLNINCVVDLIGFENNLRVNRVILNQGDDQTQYIYDIIINGDSFKEEKTTCTDHSLAIPNNVPRRNSIF